MINAHLYTFRIQCAVHTQKFHLYPEGAGKKVLQIIFKCYAGKPYSYFSCFIKDHFVSLFAYSLDSFNAKWHFSLLKAL